jgi:hypothetical protein
MNDLDLVRVLRADVPSPSAARIAAGRSRLLAATAEPSWHARRLRRPRRLIIPIGAVAAAAAVAVLASGTHPFSGTHPSSRTHPSSATHPSSRAQPSSHSGTSPRLSLPAQVLTVAANKVASGPATRPADGQWVYVKFFQTQTGVATQSTESWIRFDGSETASLQGGQPIVHDVTGPSYNTPLDAYNALAALPSSPAAIRAAASRAVGATPRDWLDWAQGNPVTDSVPKNQSQAEFDYLAEMLWLAYAAAPAEAEANVYRAIAGITGVTVNTHLTDAVGRPAIGVSANAGESWLLLDPRTYQVIGLRIKPTTFMKSAPNGPPQPSGMISMAWVEVALVSQPGGH